MSSSPDETAPLFDISGLHYRYAGAQVDALADLELEVHAGEFVAVVGANGSGKSTLARLLGGLEKPAAARHALDPQAPTAGAGVARGGAPRRGRAVPEPREPARGAVRRRRRRLRPREPGVAGRGHRPPGR